MKRKVFIPVAVIVLAAAIGFGIFLAGRSRAPDRPVPAYSPPPPEKPAEPPRTVSVYHVVIEDGKPVIRPTEREVPAGEDPIESAARHLIEQGDGADPSNPIPEGTRLLGLNVTNGLATLDLSREFQDNFQGGSIGEALVIGTILRTLGQFPEVRKVRILVEGNTIESLGHFDLSVPLDVNSVGTGFGEEN